MPVKVSFLYKDAAIKIEIGHKRFLCISDLHIGYSPSANLKINSKRIATILSNKVIELHNKTGSKNLIILGDIKHTIARTSLDEQKSLSFFFSQITPYFNNIYLVLGNHDASVRNFLPTNIQIVRRGLLLSNIYLMHGHALPSSEVKRSDTIIMGHVHPLYFKENSPLNGQRIWLIIRLYLKELYPLKKSYNLVIMPTFNSELYLPSTTKSTGNFVGKASPLLNKCKKDILSMKIISTEGVLLDIT